MERRFHIDSKDKQFMVETQPNESGRDYLITLRYNDSRFKGSHIKDVIQAYPDKIPLNILVVRQPGFNCKS